ncbi:hypothetical protein HU200_027963 [Digitaria exilis]|uniref:Uncharacterized protein n=1 Tax=Digitaria exilis TaxID=1010633 RepID=A0A835C6J9_9POAL|nr:hypothetical protein HU200_027963 [Digitaria exilis]
MSDLVVAAGQMVAGAVVQEFVSRAVSLVLGKRKDKASQGEYLDRLQKAVHEVEFMQERTAKLAITEISLLRQKIELKRQFMEAAACLLTSRRKKRQQETSQVVALSPTPHGLLPTSSGAMFPVSSFIATAKDELRLSCDDVERFERLAVSARSILTDVQSGCSLRSSMNFSSPLISHLFEWKTLSYRAMQADQERCFEVWPFRSEDRGLEAVVRYCYWDCIRPDKSFGVELVLRLSESTDIVGIAIKCLQSMTSQFNLVADTATGQLTLLASSNLQDISYSHAPPWGTIHETFSELTQWCRPNPLCCKAKGYTPCADKVVVSSQISQAFPEEVILFSFECCISAPEYNLRSSADARGKRSVMRNRKLPHLMLVALVLPHCVHDGRWRQSSYTFETIGDNDTEPIDVSIQQIGKTVRPRAINCFLRQPKVTKYGIGWISKHGAAVVVVKKLNARTQVPT